MLKAFLIGGVCLFAVLAAVYVLKRRRRRSNLVSVVALRRKPRLLTEADVRGAVRRCFDIEANVMVYPMPDGLTKGYAVISESLPTFAVIDSSRPYFEPEEFDEVANTMEDPSARAAVHEHRAWMSVDAFQFPARSTKEQRFRIYNTIFGVLLSELSDDDNLLLYLPYEERLGPADRASFALLREGRCEAVFESERLNAPIFQVESDDRAVKRAIEMAKQRLPEFIKAMTSEPKATDGLIKAGFDNDGSPEYCWLEVIDIRGDRVHARMANRPVSSSAPKEGETADIPLDQIVDWAYITPKGDAVGMFVEKVLSAQQRKG